MKVERFNESAKEKILNETKKFLTEKFNLKYVDIEIIFEDGIYYYNFKIEGNLTYSEILLFHKMMQFFDELKICDSEDYEYHTEDNGDGAEIILTVNMDRNDIIKLHSVLELEFDANKYNL